MPIRDDICLADCEKTERHEKPERPHNNLEQAQKLKRRQLILESSEDAATVCRAECHAGHHHRDCEGNALRRDPYGQPRVNLPKRLPRECCCAACSEENRGGWR